MTEARESRELKIRYAKAEGEISRRELFSIVVPKHELVPSVETAACPGAESCGLCLEACPLKAIKAEGGRITIDTLVCVGCGACAVTCPRRAIQYPGLSAKQLDSELVRLLSGGNTGPRIVAVTCQGCVADNDSSAYPSSVSLLIVPCLAAVPPWLILRAFDRGAAGLALLSRQGRCRVGLDTSRWQENVRFVQELLGCFGVRPGHMKIIDAGADVAAELTQFAARIAGLAPIAGFEPTAIPIEGLLLPALIKGLGNKLPVASKKTIRGGHVPFGMVTVAAAECTGCGLCASDCPAEALSLALGQEGVYQLLFRHETCLGCGRCVRACPEKCVTLERVLDLDRLASPPVALFEDNIARCRKCGRVLGPGATIKHLQARLAAGKLPTSQLELCPACKVGQLSLERAMVWGSSRLSRRRRAL